jgi:hypothetical protein
MHFQQLFLNYYADKSVDFSVDVTALVRNLGIVDLMTLVFGLTIGAAMALTGRSNLVKGGPKGVEQLDQYERSLMISGLVNVTKTQKGTTYQVTEMGRRFLKEFEYLQRVIEEPTLPHQDA